MMGERRRTIVFFGDSLTRADYLPEGFVDLLAARWTGVQVINEGVNGETSEDLLARVGKVRARRPDRVYLMIGTNDCGWEVPVREYRDNLATLVAALRPAEVVLITPTTSVFAKGAIEPYVAAVKEVAAREALPVVDFAAAIRDSDYSWDGLHWNEEGHRRLADLIELEAGA